jgi:cell division protein FtsB
MRLRRAAWPVLASVAFVGVLFAGVFPTRTYLAQRASISHAERQLDVLGEQNAELQARAQKLQTDAEIERLARERYNLVKPGEEAYAVLPPPSSGSTTTTTPPTQAAHREDDDRNLLQKAWDGITGLF